MTQPFSQESTLPTVAVFGTGRMGTPIARNLLLSGFPVEVWDHTAAGAAPLAADGAFLAGSPADAARDADVVLTMLPDGDAVAEVMSEPGGALAAMRPGSTWIQMGTIGVDWIERCAALASANDVELVDAPVSGSDGPARNAELLVLASGSDSARERVQPIFDAIGRSTMWLGPAGNGTGLKVALNNWIAAQVEGIAETIALTDALGIDARLFVDAIADGPLGSPYAVAKGRAMLAGNFEPGFALRLAFKDVGLALDAARTRNVELPLTEAVARRWEHAISDGYGNDDVDAVIAVATTATDRAAVTTGRRRT
ncbi:MAG: beta-hydroxyacid dehydrogenase, 3-hydroxyisobutyrate dehydrogenase [Actinomycetia bacterium]|nr:beta-hydroxyacid dehydrogenase, 3-hydroxyisobutyrate dehydrogenase [Actinomycetes bacterium]